MDQTQVVGSGSVTRSAPISPAIYRVFAVVAGSLLVALCAHVSVPLLFTPVPLTLQTFAVLLLGLTLDPAAAFAALALSSLREPPACPSSVRMAPVVYCSSWVPLGDTCF